MLKCPRCDSEEMLSHYYDDDNGNDDRFHHCTACDLSFTTDKEGAITDFGLSTGGDKPDIVDDYSR